MLTQAETLNEYRNTAEANIWALARAGHTDVAKKAQRILDKSTDKGMTRNDVARIYGVVHGLYIAAMG